MWGRLFGGHLKIEPGLFFICTGMRGGYRRGGTTIGNVFLTGRSELSGPLLRHETKHADQWAILPVVFPVAYGIAELVGRGPKGNVFERWAGLEDGGYL